VVGLGDLEIGRLIAPSLSTVRIDGGAIGRTAGGLILSNDGSRHINLGFTLLIRHTG
jgi:LacI family gluconate utilization system Gnt-I transcriptional repressor